MIGYLFSPQNIPKTDNLSFSTLSSFPSFINIFYKQSQRSSLSTEILRLVMQYL